MNKNISIQVKAVFLFMVFSLNAVVGFACSLGVDMGFNAHHHDEETPVVHVHPDGKKHHHEAAGHKHSHKNDKSSCCNDDVNRIAQAAKLLPQATGFVSPIFFTAFLATYYDNYIFHSSQIVAAKKYFELGYDPPGPAIRIFIQSFQI